MDDKEKITRYLNMIRTSASDAAEIVRRLQELYHKREESEILSPVNLNQLIQQVVLLTEPKWKSQAQASGTTIEVLTDLHPAFVARLASLVRLRRKHAALLMRGGREQAARIHPDDAAAAGIEDGAICRVSSAQGEIELIARLTDEVTPGAIAVPHGWGHEGGGWRTANAAGGVNVNVLASSEPADLERLAGMAFFNGIPVRVEAVATASQPQRERERLAPAG